MNIKVTQDDIAKGVKCHVTRCPLARALRRAGFISVRVRSKHLEFPMFGAEPIIRALPWEANRFVEAYDNDVEVYPFEFELNITGPLEVMQ